jgi:hypothetical protein
MWVAWVFFVLMGAQTRRPPQLAIPFRRVRLREMGVCVHAIALWLTECVIALHKSVALQ